MTSASPGPCGDTMGPGRRVVLGAALGVGGALLAACSGTPPATSSSAADTAGASPRPSAAAPGTSAGSTTSTATGSATTPPATTSTRPAAPQVPRVTAWQPDPNDLQPAVKVAAARVVEAVLGGAAGGGAAAARARVQALGQDPALADQAASFATGDLRVVQVVDAQYGGLLTASASVLVVCRTWTVVGRAVVAGGTTVDVRLVAASPRWRVTALHPADPGAAAPSLSSAARQVLASSRITLPPASEADVRSGQVHDSVLQAMLTLAQRFAIGVSVVRSGHPIYVFGTSRRSDHPQGRAFDTQLVDGHAVVSASTPRSLVVAYMAAAAAAGSYNVGGPYQLSGSTYFSDRTHHDHVHAGFRT